MRAHVDFLGLLFIVWGLLTVLIGASTFALGLGAASLISSASREGSGGAFAAGLTAAVFATLAVIAVIWGVAHVIVGIPLRRHGHWSRLAALILGSIDLLLLPYGTVLGAYALWTLLRAESKALFEN